MDYDLGRIDYTLCGITYPDCLKILPATEQKLQQRFAIGDKNGVLQCLVIKDEEPIVQFKTLPGKPITSVQLASSLGSNSDKIFAASGNEVKGYTRKGKVFFSIETSVSETITSMCVLGSDLILCCGRTLTFYRELHELYSLVCDDRILDAVAFSTPNNTRIRIFVIIANKEALLIENGQIKNRLHIPAGPVRINIPLSSHPTDVCVFYGAADGSVGLIIYNETGLSSKCLLEERGLGSVMCCGWFTNSSGTHFAVGRHDGSIQLYLINTDNLSEKPRLKFTYFSGEPVTSVAGGSIGTEEPELLVATFSGRIFGLRSRRLVSSISSINNSSADALATRRSKLETEIARLEKQIVNERDKYQKNTRSLFGGVSAPPLLDVQYELSGASHNGWQEAKIISAVSLDMIFIYCNSKLEIQTDSAAVLSMCAQQEFNTTELLATIRCQAGTRRLWLRIRVISFEDIKIEATKILIYILPVGSPRVARMIKLPLPILPHYSKYESLEVEKTERSWCEVHVYGGFSVAEMTSWLVELLPGELPRPATNVAFARSHSTLGTYLICRYQRGSAVLKSDNITTIAVIKNVISNCCVKRSIKADITCDIPEDACLISFQYLKDKIKFEYKKNKDVKIKKAISSLELDINLMNDEIQPLCVEYLRILELLNDDFSDSCFNELIETVENWYVDYYKLTLNGNFCNDELSQLKFLLRDCQVAEVEQILSFTKNKIHSNSADY